VWCRFASGRAALHRERMIPAAMLRVGFAVVCRPWLWLEAVRAAQAHGCKEWWKRLLFVPESEYLAWRLDTAYGAKDAKVDPGDFIRYLEWRRRQRVE
jgi:hypothetical protein